MTPYSPGADSQMRVSRSPNGAGAVVVAMTPLFQRLEVRQQRLQVVRCERHHWHVVAGFDRLGVADPAGEVAARVLEGAGRERQSAREVGEVRADVAERLGAPNGMTRRARRFLEHRLSRGSIGIGRGTRARALC